MSGKVSLKYDQLMKRYSRGAASGDIFAQHLAAHQRIWN